MIKSTGRDIKIIIIKPEKNKREKDKTPGILWMHGGGLTATLCMYARDKKEVNIAYQMPLYPMLDCKDTESSKDNHSFVWNTRKNHKAWKLYLGGLKKIPAYASASRQTDYSNLPPAYTFISDKDPLYSETVTYIESLKKAGIKAEIYIYRNSPHGFDISVPQRLFQFFLEKFFFFCYLVYSFYLHN